MKEYVADRKTGKALYKRTRKLYKRYKYGMLIIVLLLLIMLVLNFRILMRAENRSQIFEILILIIGEDILFFIAVMLVRAFAISGGYEVLKSRRAEKCFFTDRCFILEYEPNAHETMVYERISFEFDYQDIQEIVDEERFRRIALYGSYKVRKYRTSHDDDDVESYMISDMPLYVYGYYKEYDEIKSKLLGLTRNPGIGS